MALLQGNGTLSCRWVPLTGAESMRSLPPSISTRSRMPSSPQPRPARSGVVNARSSKPSPSSFYHEALHHVLTPLTDRLDSIATNRFKDLFALATSDGHIGYSHIDEAFVRTLGCVLAGKLNHDADSTVLAWVTNEYKLGFILCLPIYEQLKGYEATNMTFQEYFPRILTNIDVEREKLRWLELTKKAK